MTFLKTTFLLLLLCCSFTVLFSQNDNDLYLFTLEKTGKGEYHLHNAKYLSDFNKGGYTNQPSFTPGGDLLVSVRKRNDSQNDIWLLLLNSKKYKILTRTPASEYSPRIHPDEEHITVVRKINGEPIDQQVCNIPLRSGEMTCISEEIKDAGYYSWLGEKGLALYRIEGSGSRLAYYNVSDNKSRRVTTSIGRTLLGDKAGNLIYIHKFTDEYWYIKKYNPSNSEIDIITQTVAKNEDFAMAPDETLFMGKDHLLYSFHPDRGKEWKQVADLSVYGIKYITRIAISPDSKKIVIAATKTKS